jgi:hypothetical protein
MPVTRMAVRAIYVDSGFGDVGCGVDRHGRRSLQDVLKDLVVTLAAHQPAANMMGVADRRSFDRCNCRP